jgi:hypothetical protein
VNGQSDTESGFKDFNIEDPDDDPPLRIESGGEVQIWQPISTGPRNFNIQEPEGAEPGNTVYAGRIDTWAPIDTQSL